MYTQKVLITPEINDIATSVYMRFFPIILSSFCHYSHIIIHITAFFITLAIKSIFQPGHGCFVSKVS